jgi:predicted esterase YcpF (UPF0227 family)
MILYLHGFNSSPASHKARTMQAWMQARGLGERFVCPVLPPQPRAAAALIDDFARRTPADRLCLVGSSLGGFYATHFTEKLGARAVLLNPAVDPHAGLESALGPQQNLYTGERYELRREDLEGWRELATPTIDPERYLLIVETGDEVLDYRRALARYAGARMVVREGGDHMLQSFAEHLPRILRFAGLA